MNIRGYSVCSAGRTVDWVMRRQRERERFAAEAARAGIADWPEPEVTCRPADDENEVPRTARSVRAKARARGWRVFSTYARGTVAVRGKPGRVVDSLCLWFYDQRPGARMMACWHDGAFDSAVDLVRLRKLGYRELLVWLTES